MKFQNASCWKSAMAPNPTSAGLWKTRLSASMKRLVRAHIQPPVIEHKRGLLLCTLANHLLDEFGLQRFRKTFQVGMQDHGSQELMVLLRVRKCHRRCF